MQKLDAYIIMWCIFYMLLLPRELVNMSANTSESSDEDSALLWSSSSHVSYALSSDYPSFFSFCWNSCIWDFMLFWIVVFTLNKPVTFSTLGCLQAVI